jgi:hypothetical protein
MLLRLRRLLNVGWYLALIAYCLRYRRRARAND